ncbi:g13113 [Coccomyxa viridis]|uniref:G13113 protein n=1 Tax=Coccomyxa viridis TaxID=1274662 RepID=A0ABP1GHJ1_9CHLO
MSLGAIARRAAKQVIHEASIKVPPAVQVSKTADLLTFKGPLGTSHLGLSRIDTLGDAALKLSPESREIAICSPSKGFFGTLQSLLRNKIEGVTKGFLVYLRIQGIGYRATLKDQTLQFKLGYSHDISYELPPAMRAFLPEPTLVGLYGIDKNQVTQAAANIIRLRPPSVYKGKGIRLADTTPRTKPGKRK